MINFFHEKIICCLPDFLSCDIDIKLLLGYTKCVKMQTFHVRRVFYFTTNPLYFDPILFPCYSCCFVSPDEGGIYFLPLHRYIRKFYNKNS